MNADLKPFIESLHIDYRAEFVPFSESRNAKPQPSVKDYSLNWKVTIKKSAGEFTTDYMQGIGHIPGYSFSFGRMTVGEYESIVSACETGRYIPEGATITNKSLPSPTLEDVLYSLVMDSEAIESDFEEWASNYGYDADSRKAENIYNECLKEGLALRRILGDSNLAHLRELFQDY